MNTTNIHYYMLIVKILIDLLMIFQFKNTYLYKLLLQTININIENI